MSEQDDAMPGTPLVLAVQDQRDGKMVAIPTGLRVWFDIENGDVVLPMSDQITAVSMLDMMSDFVRGGMRESGDV